MKLYKYMSFESAIRLLRDGCVRFTQPGDFNDPFEMNPSFDLMSKQDLDGLPDAPDVPGMKILTPEALKSMFAAILPGLQKEISKHAGQDGAFVLRNNELAQSTLDDEFGVFCLSEAADNLLMWAHYADNHRGVAIQFDTESKFFSEDSLGSDLPSFRTVEYIMKRPILSHSNLRSPSLLFRKSPEWSYEREWRYIRRLSEAHRVIDSMPYPIHLFGLPEDSISGIVVGCRVLQQDRCRLFDSLSDSPIAGATIFQARLHDEEYRLQIDPPLDGKFDPAALAGRVCSARLSDERT